METVLCMLLYPIVGEESKCCPLVFRSREFCSCSYCCCLAPEQLVQQFPDFSKTFVYYIRNPATAMPAQ
jgi:hypothetical protein